MDVQTEKTGYGVGQRTDDRGQTTDDRRQRTFCQLSVVRCPLRIKHRAVGVVVIRYSANLTL